MEFGFIIILFVFVNMYVCIVYCMYCFDLKWNSHVDSINDNHPTEIVEYASPVFHYGIPNLSELRH